MDKKYKIRPCKIPLLVKINDEMKITEDFLKEVICYIRNNAVVFDIPKPHKHWKNYWILDFLPDDYYCYEIKK